MVLLASTPTRGVADIMEASLIFNLEYSGVNLQNNLNFAKYPFAREVYNDELHLEYYLYVALRELPRGKKWRQENAAKDIAKDLNDSAVSARLNAMFQREQAIMKFLGRNWRFFEEALKKAAEAGPGVMSRERGWVEDEDDVDELAKWVMMRIEDANAIHELTASGQDEASGQAAVPAGPEAYLMATARRLMNLMEGNTWNRPAGSVRIRDEVDNEIINAGSRQEPYEWEPVEIDE